jgi:hypothetical protein
VRGRKLFRRKREKARRKRGKDAHSLSLRRSNTCATVQTASMLPILSSARAPALPIVDEAGCSKDSESGSAKTQSTQLRVAGRLKTLVLAGLRVPTTEQRAWQGGGAGLFGEGKGKVSERGKRGDQTTHIAPRFAIPLESPNLSAEAAVEGGEQGRTTLSRHRSRSVALLLHWKSRENYPDLVHQLSTQLNSFHLLPQLSISLPSSSSPSAFLASTTPAGNTRGHQRKF